jgi:hypothetical protein
MVIKLKISPITNLSQINICINLTIKHSFDLSVNLPFELTEMLSYFVTDTFCLYIIKDTDSQISSYAIF